MWLPGGHDNDPEYSLIPYDFITPLKHNPSELEGNLELTGHNPTILQGGK